MGDDITIGVTEIVNNIEVTAQPNDQIVDISVIDNADDVTLNITPTVIEINVNKGSSYAKWGTILGTLSDQTDLQDALDLKADLVDGKVPSSQLPSYVDDVIEVANYAALPATGETGKIYVTIDNNKIFRWTGSTYVEIIDSAAVWGAITGTLSSQTDLQNALNLKANDNAVVKLTGDQSIAGSKSFTTNTAAPAMVVTNNSTDNGILLQNTSTGRGATSNNVSTGIGIYSGNSSTGTGIESYNSSSGTGFYSNNSSTGNGIQSINSSSGYGISSSNTGSGRGIYSSNNSTGDAINIANSGSGRGIYLTNASTGNSLILNNGTSATGMPFTVSKNGTDKFTINDAGEATGVKFIKSGGTSSQFLKADGSVDSSNYSLDNAVVHLTGNETISGVKTLQNTLNLTAGVNIDDAYGFYWKTNVGEIETALAGIGQSSSGLNFFTGSSFVSPRMVINSSGNVGIGTTSPSYKLDVSGDTQITGVGIIGTAQTTNLLYIGNPSSIGNKYIVFSRAANLTDIVNIQGIDAGVGPANIALQASGGNVGIGTTSPSFAFGSGLHVKSNSGWGEIRIEGQSFAGGTGSVISFTSEGTALADIYADTDKNLSFRTNGASERMRILANGNVGIGTTSPSEKFQVGNSFKVTNDGVVVWGQTNSNGLLSWDTNLAIIGGLANTAVQFRANNAEAMRITSGGNVGIGTTSPTAPLHVKGSGAYAGVIVDNTGTTGGGYFAARQNGSQVGIVGVSGAIIGDTSSNMALFSETGKSVDFMTDGSATIKMRITSGGNVGIGTTSPAQKLEVKGNISIQRIDSSTDTGLVFANEVGTSRANLNFSATNERLYYKFGSSELFSILTSGNVGIGTNSPSYQLQLSTDSAAKPTSALWTIASDERIKENINSYTKGLNELLKINPITYDYNGLGGFKKGKGGVGIIAQEIAEILPDSVSSIKGKLNETDEEEIDILNFNGHELTYILINAVKELKAEIEILKNK